MIEFRDCKVNKTKPVATDIFIIFEDTEVSEKQFKFLKDKLDDYILEINEEYDLETKTDYDKSSKVLLIGITVVIPDRLLPKGSTMSDVHTPNIKLIADHIAGFRQFYERQKDLSIPPNPNKV